MAHTTAALPSITPAGDPAVLAHSVSSASSANAAESSQLEGESKDDQASGSGSSGRAEKNKTPEEEELDRQIEALAVPGFALHQEGVFTVIRRVQRTGRSRTFPARLAR